MSSTIVKLLTWVEHEIYKRFYSFYIVCQLNMFLIFFYDYLKYFSNTLYALTRLLQAWFSI